MGRRSCPSRAKARPIRVGRRFGDVAGRLFRARPWARGQSAVIAAAAVRLALCAAVIVAAMIGANPAAAATIDSAPPKPAAGQPPDKMFVEANELRYDTVKNTVSAVGDARVYYKGRVLEADRVTYDRNTGRVFAEGHAKLTETDGTVLYGDQFDLTDDFRNGFIESLRADTSQKTFFSSPHTERIEGDTTVFDKGTYTACAACKDNPDKPPLWRVRAKRIIHKNDEQMIYYEDFDARVPRGPARLCPVLFSAGSDRHPEIGRVVAAFHHEFEPRLRRRNSDFLGARPRL